MSFRRAHDLMAPGRCRVSREEAENQAATPRLRPHPSSQARARQTSLSVIICQKAHPYKHRLPAWPRCGVDQRVLMSVIHTPAYRLCYTINKTKAKQKGLEWPQRSVRPMHDLLRDLPFSQQMWQESWEEEFDREWQAVALFLRSK